MNYLWIYLIRLSIWLNQINDLLCQPEITKLQVTVFVYENIWWPVFRFNFLYSLLKIGVYNSIRMKVIKSLCQITSKFSHCFFGQLIKISLNQNFSTIPFFLILSIRTNHHRHSTQKRSKDDFLSHTSWKISIHVCSSNCERFEPENAIWL